MLTIEGDGMFSADVVGESHCQRWVERVAGGRRRE